MKAAHKFFSDLFPIAILYGKQRKANGKYKVKKKKSIEL